MHRFFAFILLLSHMNTSMFLPQVPQEDVYDESGNQLDDITSVYEWVMVELGYDHQADDENDDSGQSFHVPHFEYFVQPIFKERKNTSINRKERKFFYPDNEKAVAASYDILKPPPKR